MSMIQKESSWKNERSPQEREASAWHVRRNTEAAVFQFSTYLLSIMYVSGSVLDTGERARESVKQGESLVPGMAWVGPTCTRFFKPQLGGCESAVAGGLYQGISKCYQSGFYHLLRELLLSIYSTPLCAFSWRRDGRQIINNSSGIVRE